nr:cytochrome P450 [Kibdelosporangium sp. MJ126-NF4]
MDYNPLDPATLRDPYPVYRRLREAHPVHWNDAMGCWVLSRYEDCRFVLKDHDAFSNDMRKVGEFVPDAGINIQTIDPPEHSAVHSLLMNSVRHQNLADFEAAVLSEATRRLASLAVRPQFDLVTDFVEPLCLRSISEFFGVTPPESDFFREIAHRIVRSMDSALVPEAQAPGVRAMAQLAELVDSWLAEPPAHGLLGYLARRQHAEDGLPRQMLVNSVRVLFLAGSTSLAAAITSGLHVLVREGVNLDRLGRGEELDVAVEELFRFDPPIQGTTRVCLRDTTVGAVHVKRGEFVLVLFGAANRDPDRFAEPDRFVVDRRPNPHLGFGWGVHACVGGLFAKLMMRATVAGLARYPEFRQVGPVEFRDQATVRAASRLPVSLSRH